MKLHGLTRVKNEGDVIEEFVRHNLRYLDALTVVDNASFDGTVSILEALQAEGLPVKVSHDSTLPMRQSEAMTRLARQSAAESDWDFLFLLDADEFLKVTDRRVLEESLTWLSPQENGLIPLLTYVPTAYDPADEPRVLDRIRFRRAVESEPAYKCILSRGFANGGEFAIIQGNHTARDANGRARATALANVELAHFPVRDLAQIQGKILLGWGGYLAMGYDSVGLAWHQRRLFEKLESAPAWSAGDLYEIALRYTDAGGSPDEPPLRYDPLPPVPVTRRGNTAIHTPMQFAARYVRQLAGALAKYETTAVRERQPGKGSRIRNLFVTPVHESPECVFDLAANLRRMSPSSGILLYDGSASQSMMRFSGALMSPGVSMQPSPQPITYGRLHEFFFAAADFALSNLEFDIMTIVDSDQLLLRPGYPECLEPFLTRPSIGLIADAEDSPESAHRHGFGHPLQVAASEMSLWGRFISEQGGNAGEFPDYTFWPGTVFTRPAVAALVRMAASSKTLQAIVDETRVPAIEEILLPTMVRLAGFETIPTPLDDRLLRWRPAVSQDEAAEAARSATAFWAHPVPRVYHDPARAFIRSLPDVSSSQPRRNGSSTSVPAVGEPR